MGGNYLARLVALVVGSSLIGIILGEALHVRIPVISKSTNDTQDRVSVDVRIPADARIPVIPDSKDNAFLNRLSVVDVAPRATTDTGSWVAYLRPAVLHDTEEIVKNSPLWHQVKFLKDFVADHYQAQGDPYLNRFSEHIVLSVVSVEEPRGNWQYFRGRYMELHQRHCAEEVAVVAALGNSVHNKLSSLRYIATVALYERETRVFPCGTCQEIFRRIRMHNPNFLSVSFTNETMKEFHAYHGDKCCSSKDSTPVVLGNIR